MSTKGSESTHQSGHESMYGYQYVYPVTDMSHTMYVHDKEAETLKNLLERMAEQRGSDVEEGRQYIYPIHDDQFGILLPPPMEEAVCTGEIKNLMLSKDGKKMMVQMKQGLGITLKMKTMTEDEFTKGLETNTFVEGKGKSNDVKAQHPIRPYNRRKTSDSLLGAKKLFEMRDEAVAEEETKDAKIKKKQEKIRSKKSVPTLDTQPLESIQEVKTPHSAEGDLQNPFKTKVNEEERVVSPSSSNNQMGVKNLHTAVERRTIL